MNKLILFLILTFYLLPFAAKEKVAENQNKIFITNTIIDGSGTAPFVRGQFLRNQNKIEIIGSKQISSIPSQIEKEDATEKAIITNAINLGNFHTRKPDNVREKINIIFKYKSNERIKEDEILIVNLWETSCKPCIGEIPSLNKIVEDYSNDKIRFIAFSDEHPDRLKQFNFINFQKRRPDLIFKYEQYFGYPDISKYIRSLETKHNGKGVPIHLLIKADGTLGLALLGASDAYDKIIREFIDKEIAGFASENQITYNHE